MAKKNEEKKKKEDERLRILEEKRKQQEDQEREKQRKEEKIAKQANMFSMFFQKSPAATKVKTLKVEQPQAFSGGKRTSESSSGDPESDKENSSDAHSSKENRMRTEIVAPTDDDDEDVQIVLVKKPEVASFSPLEFQIKSNMAVAPILRRNPLNESEREYLKKLMDGTENSLKNGAATSSGEDVKNPLMNTYLSDLVQRCKRKELRKFGRTVIVDNTEEEETDKDVELVMEDVIRPNEGYVKFRMKLLQFDKNRRPAYWGTWKRQAKSVKPVKPWAKEEV